MLNKNIVKEIERSIISEGTKLDIICQMIDWFRIIDINYNVIFANGRKKKDLGLDISGKKCYELLGKETKCDNCITRDTPKIGDSIKRNEIIGDKIFNIRTSPILSEEGEIIAFVEVFRDITNEIKLAKNLEVKNKKMISDIQFAINMQERMLPIPGIYNGLLLNYLYKPSEMLSGDIFDVYKIDYNHTGIYMCDVVGHGIAASLLTIFVRQSMRTISKNNVNINKILSDLHKTFLSLNLESDKYFSMFFGIYNNKTRVYSYINAGHNAIPILLRDGELKLLEAKGYPICNIFDTVKYEVNTIQLEERDRLILYSDGIVEARNENGEQFGMDRLLELVKEENDILTKLNENLADYTKVQLDDYAILVMDIV